VCVCVWWHNQQSFMEMVFIETHGLSINSEAN